MGTGLVMGTVLQAQSPAPAAQPGGNLAQLMRGMLFPNANIIFDGQSVDPAQVLKWNISAPEGTATNKFGTLYSGWPAVVNAGVVLAEAANLLTMPRMCENGKPAPVNAADWKEFVKGLREAGLAAVKAGQSRSQDNVIEAAGTVTEACAACHTIYRERPRLADRCTPPPPKR